MGKGTIESKTNSVKRFPLSSEFSTPPVFDITIFKEKIKDERSSICRIWRLFKKVTYGFHRKNENIKENDTKDLNQSVLSILLREATKKLIKNNKA